MKSETKRKWKLRKERKEGEVITVKYSDLVGIKGFDPEFVDADDDESLDCEANLYNLGRTLDGRCVIEALNDSSNLYDRTIAEDYPHIKFDPVSFTPKPPYWYGIEDKRCVYLISPDDWNRLWACDNVKKVLLHSKSADSHKKIND